MPDLVNHPPHYTRAIEVFDFITCYELSFPLGNVVKYLARHADKGTPLQDLEKAQWYLSRAIEQERARTHA